VRRTIHIRITSGAHGTPYELHISSTLPAKQKQIADYKDQKSWINQIL